MATKLNGRGCGFTEEEAGAMRRVESMLELGQVVLAKDPWRRGAQTFVRPEVAARWACRHGSPRLPLWRRLWLAVIG